MSAASRHGINGRLVEAIIAVESAFNPRAVSRKGAMGLMQLMPKTARQYAVRNPFDPLQNIQGGLHLLRDLLHRFQGDLRLALAAYNAGEKAVVEYDGIPPYRETREYVKKVLRRYGGATIMYPRATTAYRVYRGISPGGTPHYSNLPPLMTFR
jgi:soluble lytic murein transglycosylase-like protein